MSPWLDRWLRLRDHLAEDLLGGPRWLEYAWVINAQKGGTLLFVLACMAITGNHGVTAWVYAGLHGSYGLIWLLKHWVFPDPGWSKRITVAGAAMVWLLVLGPYWIAPVLLTTSGAEAPAWRMGAAVLLYAVGVVVMVGADAQKYFVLKARPGLITDGFYARVRHPNYLGEMMLYASFALLSMHALPWLVLAWVWGGVFVPNMLRKEARMARHPGWAEYKARTGFLLPRP
jgi:protein-S-isoprenylcysteine O-methyltransferase Ste14